MSKLPGGPTVDPALQLPPEAEKLRKPEDPVRITLAQETAGDPTLKDIIDYLIPDSIHDPVTKAKLQELRIIVDREKPLDEQIQVLEICIDVLNYLGYKDKAEMHKESLVLKSGADVVAAEINSRLTQGKLPLRQYKSNVGIYGYAPNIEGEKLVYRKRLRDQIIDKIENAAFKADDLGGNIFTSFLKKGLRRKATVEEVQANIQAFGLDQYFSSENGEFRENLESLGHHAMLDDLLRLGARDHKFLQNLDPVEALKVATKMVLAVHQKSQSGIGIITNNIVLEVKDNHVVSARLTLPDMVYEPHVDKCQQQAMDLIDLCFSAGIAGVQSGGAQKGKPEEFAKRNIQTILDSYSDEGSEAFMVKQIMKTLVETVPAGLTWHNKRRYGFDRIREPAKHFEFIKNVILRALN